MAPVPKRRKINSGKVEEITFDPSARQDYLTGFHKRKQARIQNARETAAKMEKEERVKQRQELRQQRKVDLEKHLAEFNAELRKQNPDMSDREPDADGDGDAEEWNGIDGFAEPEVEAVEVEEDEYVDEDKYTTVTVEPMGGPDEEPDVEAASDRKAAAAPVPNGKTPKKRPWDRSADGKPKPKKKKFRYESKAERQHTRQQEHKKSKAARARREKAK